jgi:hypothetical protein
MSPCLDSETMLVPEHFICPISLEIMRDPVMNKGGQNYDRRSILQWLHRGNKNCPLTRQPLAPSQLAPNTALWKTIQEWKKEQGMETEQEEDEEAETLFLNKVGMITIDAEVETSTPKVTNEDDEDGDDLTYLRELYDEILESWATLEYRGLGFRNGFSISHDDVEHKKDNQASGSLLTACATISSKMRVSTGGAIACIPPKATKSDNDSGAFLLF